MASWTPTDIRPQPSPRGPLVNITACTQLMSVGPQPTSGPNRRPLDPNQHRPLNPTAVGWALMSVGRLCWNAKRAPKVVDQQPACPPRPNRHAPCVWSCCGPPPCMQGGPVFTHPSTNSPLAAPHPGGSGRNPVPRRPQWIRSFISVGLGLGVKGASFGCTPLYLAHHG